MPTNVMDLAYAVRDYHDAGLAPVSDEQAEQIHLIAVDLFKAIVTSTYIWEQTKQFEHELFEICYALAEYTDGRFLSERNNDLPKAAEEALKELSLQSEKV